MIFPRALRTVVKMMCPDSWERYVTKTVYLAGPAVFWPNAQDEAVRLKALCREQSLSGLFPLDSPVDPDGLTLQEIAARIKHANIAMIRQADAVIADLSPFRGTAADPGTAFEVGFAQALGKPVFAYSLDRRTYVDRVSKAHSTHTDTDGEVRDAHAHLVEDFGLSENLMLAADIEIYGDAKAAIKAAARHLT